MKHINLCTLVRVGTVGTFVFSCRCLSELKKVHLTDMIYFQSESGMYLPVLDEIHES